MTIGRYLWGAYESHEPPSISSYFESRLMPTLSAFVKLGCLSNCCCNSLRLVFSGINCSESGTTSSSYKHWLNISISSSSSLSSWRSLPCRHWLNMSISSPYFSSSCRNVFCRTFSFKSSDFQAKLLDLWRICYSVERSPKGFFKTGKKMTCNVKWKKTFQWCKCYP